ncbi:sulfatase [Candidatus Binatia bacterium]|nr:sulfatase [Candidatus Binatia bacterium]
MLAAVLAAACTSPPPPPPPDPLVVEKPFTGERVPQSLDVRDATGRVVGEEARPVLAYLPRLDLPPVGAPSPVEGAVRQTFAVPPKFRGVPLRVKRRYRHEGDLHWKRLPPTLMPATGEQLAVDFPLDESIDRAGLEFLASVALIKPEIKQSFRNLHVPRGAVLIGGYGLDPESAALTRGPVGFRITARVEGAEFVLLDATVDPRAPDAESWTDYRIDLGKFEDRDIDVEMHAAVRGGAGTQNVAAPVWSVPRILAAKPADDRLNVVLISIDTLRADFVGVYGHDRPTTPILDQFAATGALFERTVTTYPSTTASHMSMLTGLYPAVHGVYAPGHRISPKILPLAEQLAKSGYQTAAITEDGMLAAGVGFPRGFADYREYKEEPGPDGYAGDVVQTAIDWLTRHHGQRFFLFLHTYQVHGPYTPPRAYDVFKTYTVDGVERSVGDDTPEDVRARLGYEGDLLYTDAQIGRLLATLDELGEAERTLVVVTADHGEALGEHGIMGHGWYVNEPVLHVPLMLRAPGRVRSGLRIAPPVSLVDVTPTILDLARVPPAGQMQGISLAPLLTGEGQAPPPDRVVHAEKASRVGKAVTVARRGDVKWVVKSDGVMRYDLASDPGEDRGIAEGADGEGARLVAAYDAANAEFRARFGESGPDQAPVDDATKARLRALGYIP